MKSAAPLNDVLVVDLSRALAGPHAAMMLGDMGARVIKVESEAGDDTRHWGPPFVGPEGEEISTYFLAANRNKESIVLDLKASAGISTLVSLVARADVLIENFRPGVMERLGLSTERLQEINPRLVVLSITGFGHDGPEGMRPGYDQIAQGEAGLMSLTGPSPEDPQRVGVPIGDLLAGMNGAFGVLAALHQRATTGKGRVVRTSLLASIVGVHALMGTAYTVAGRVGHAQGNHHSAIAPYGLFRARDGAVQIACGNETLWRRFAREFSIPAEDPRFGNNANRVDHRDILLEQIELAFGDLSLTEIIERTERIGVPCGRVRTIDEVYEWDQTISQHLLLQLQHPVLGEITLPGSPIRFDDNMFSSGRTTHEPPPQLGEHSAAIERWLKVPAGMSTT